MVNERELIANMRARREHKRDIEEIQERLDRLVEDIRDLGATQDKLLNLIDNNQAAIKTLGIELEKLKKKHK